MMPTGRSPRNCGKQTPNALWTRSPGTGHRADPRLFTQAKGRIERAWRTCQDRLVSELRLAQAATLLQANTVLEQFCADYNRRFARPAAEAVCNFRALPRRFILARCLSLHYQRVVGADHIIRLGSHAIALPALHGHRGYHLSRSRPNETSKPMRTIGEKSLL